MHEMTAFIGTFFFFMFSFVSLVDYETFLSYQSKKNSRTAPMSKKLCTFCRRIFQTILLYRRALIFLVYVFSLHFSHYFIQEEKTYPTVVVYDNRYLFAFVFRYTAQFIVSTHKQAKSPFRMHALNVDGITVDS